jgi:rhodanese-related sulfurtransferase
MNENRNGILLIDARDPEQFATATIRGAVNIPIDDLDSKLDGLPDDKPIVFFCNRGGTAGEAYDFLKEFRPELEAYFLSAEMSCDKQGNYTIIPIE